MAWQPGSLTANRGGQIDASRIFRSHPSTMATLTRKFIHYLSLMASRWDHKSFAPRRSQVMEFLQTEQQFVALMPTIPKDSSNRWWWLNPAREYPCTPSPWSADGNFQFSQSSRCLMDGWRWRHTIWQNCRWRGIKRWHLGLQPDWLGCSGRSTTCWHNWPFNLARVRLRLHVNASYVTLCL